MSTSTLRRRCASAPCVARLGNSREQMWRPSSSRRLAMPAPHRPSVATPLCARVLPPLKGRGRTPDLRPYMIDLWLAGVRLVALRGNSREHKQLQRGCKSLCLCRLPQPPCTPSSQYQTPRCKLTGAPGERGRWAWAPSKLVAKRVIMHEANVAMSHVRRVMYSPRSTHSTPLPPRASLQRPGGEADAETARGARACRPGGEGGRGGAADGQAFALAGAHTVLPT